MIRVGEALQPLIDLMRQDLLEARVVHSDETAVQVLKEAGRRPDQKSYMWVQVAGTGPPIVMYHYAPSRARSVVSELLDGYEGTLVTDGYSAYEALPGAGHAGCWAHARRKFHEALKAQPKGKKGKTGKAQIGFNLVQRLFLLERDLVVLVQQFSVPGCCNPNRFRWFIEKPIQPDAHEASAGVIVDVFVPDQLYDHANAPFRERTDSLSCVCRDRFGWRGWHLFSERLHHEVLSQMGTPGSVGSEPCCNSGMDGI